MARPDPVLSDWLKSAYSMEIGLIPVLEKQVSDTRNDANAQHKLREHLDQTRQHAELVKGCLERLGENVTSIQPTNPIFHVHSEAELAKQGQSATPPAYRDDMLSYANESFEVASYEALRTLAQSSGDQDTARVTEQILRDEREMVRWLDDKISGNGHSTRAAGPDSEVTRIAQAVYDALNQRDLDQVLSFYPEDAQTELATHSRPLNKQQSRDWVADFMKAFPDCRFDVLRRIAEGDFVTTQYRVGGTQTGPLVDRQNGTSLPPTGKKISVQGCSVFEVKNGKIPHQWIYVDNSQLLQQLGFMAGAIVAPGTQPRQQMSGEAGAARAGASKMAEVTTPEHDNLRTVRDSYDALNAHDMDRFDSLNTDDFRGEAPGTTHPLTKRDNRQYIQNFINAFPDLHFELTRVLAQGDLVTTDWTGTGTNNGPLQAPDGNTVPPGHKKVTVYGSNTYQLKNGKITRTWTYYDMSILMQQMGLMPGPQARS
jgi:steroid delta-isomerase-like uncharacterized protein